jgi:hypothetical protein
MKKNTLYSAAIFLCIANFAGSASGAVDMMEKIKKEQTAMSAVIEQFTRDKNICNDEKDKVKFAIHPYLAAKDQMKWPKEIQKGIAACQEKYLVNMDRKGVQTQYVYCYDRQVPKLLAPAPDSMENKKDCSKDK